MSPADEGAIPSDPNLARALFQVIAVLEKAFGCSPEMISTGLWGWFDTRLLVVPSGNDGVFVLYHGAWEVVVQIRDGTFILDTTQIDRLVALVATKECRS